MQRIIDGVAYNTETAAKVASLEFDASSAGGTRGAEVLYQTRGGAFFRHVQEVVAYQNRGGEWQERESNQFEAMTRDEAHAWVMKQNDVELLSDVFGEPPEASARDAVAAEATIYARVPLSLKNQVETLARADGLSVNSFVIRCLESCAASRRMAAEPPPNALSNIISGQSSAIASNPLLTTVSGQALPAPRRNALLDAMSGGASSAPRRNPLLGG